MPAVSMAGVEKVSPESAQTKSGRLLLAAAGSAARVPDRQQPDAVRDGGSRPAPRTDRPRCPASQQQGCPVRQRDRQLAGAAGRSRSSGEDAGKGGKYLFLPPGYTGRALTATSSSIADDLRSRGLSPHHPRTRHARRWVAYSQTLKVYPLAEASNPQTKYIDAYPKPWKTLPVYDLTYFRDLAAVVNDEPAQERDAVMLGLLATIGIEKGKPFNPTGERPAHSSGPRRKPMPRCRTTSRRRERRSFRTGRTASGGDTTLRRRTSRSWSKASSWSTNTPAALRFGDVAAEKARRGERLSDRAPGWLRRASLGPENFGSGCPLTRPRAISGRSSPTA